jgi:hypothetical protein
MAVKKTFEFFFTPLLKKFFQDMGRDPNNLEMILLRQKAGQLFKDSNKVINFPQKRSFKEEIEAMKKSGDLVDEDNIIISDKITDREMFKNSNLNKPTIEGQMEKITGASNKIKQIQKEQADMYKPKSDAEIKAKYDKENKESIQRFKDKMKKDEPDDMATGGRAGFYTGGITDVEPSLDDIGHGSDSLMARTRLVSPGSQATTSTGLNYLLAEDNDNIRVPFSAGGGGRRAFLKLMATLGGATAAAKSGILTLGEGGAKKAVTETVKQSAGSGQPPPYFFRLVEKIKFMGDDTLASQDKAIAKKYKDYIMEEDFAGNITIMKKGADDMYPEDVYMSYKVDEVPVKGKKGSSKVEEYEEFTATPDGDGKMKNIEQGVPDEIIEEAGDTTAMTLKKADGGRIGFRIGGSPRKFLERVFGKDKFKNMIENDPELEQGMLEVVDMFRKKDKEGLKMYLQKFLPDMGDAEIEDFIIGSGDIAGIEGQLLRLGSGRDYRNKLEMIKEAENVRKLEDFDIEGVSKNAEGGRIGFSGGGIFRAIIAKAAAKQGLKPYEFIKVTSYKSLPPEVKMFLSADDFAKLKSGQQDMYSNYIDMAKTRKNFQEQVEGGKTTPARELFESMEKTMDEQSFVPKTVTDKDIAEMELMVKNRFNKGRKDNAEGGLQTMLGE